MTDQPDFEWPFVRAADNLWWAERRIAQLTAELDERAAVSARVNAQHADLVAGLNELVDALTRHADALSVMVDALIDSDCGVQSVVEARRAVDEYHNFIREA